MWCVDIDGGGNVMAITYNPHLNPYEMPSPYDFRSPQDYERACDEFRRYGRHTLNVPFPEMGGMRGGLPISTGISEKVMAERISDLERQLADKQMQISDKEKQLAEKNQRISQLAGEKAAERMKQDAEEITAMAYSVPTVEPSETPEAMEARKKKCKAAINSTYDSMIKLKLWKW